MFLFKKNQELEVILSEIDDLDLPESDRENVTRQIKRNMFFHNVITVFYVALFLVAWFVLFYGLFSGKFILMLGAVVGLFLAFVMMFISAKVDMDHIRSYEDIFFKECNTQKALVIYKLLFSYISRVKQVDPTCFNIMIVSLRQNGYDELAEKYLTRLRNYNAHPMWETVVNINLIKNQFINGDHQGALEALEKEIIKEEKLESEYKGLANYIEANKKNLALLQMYINKEYDKLLVVLEDRINNYDKTNLEKVRNSYYAYGVAEKLGDKEKSNKYLDFVAKHSGTICFDKPFPVL